MDEPMRCAVCHHEHAPEASFCSRCGSSLEIDCSACGTRNRPGSRACANCGAPLSRRSAHADAQDAAPATGAKAWPSTEHAPLERRSVTVMFCDLVDSTALSARLDPEELGEILLAYRETCAATVRRYGGYVARFIGDSLLIYFGYPQAHEDDAVRAVRAALQIGTEMERLADRLTQRAGGRLSVHIGIHTGEVIAGDFGSGTVREHAAVVGETPNIAARLQSAAGPGEILISQATYKLVQAMFACEPLENVKLKGIEAPVSAHRVLRAHAVQSGNKLWTDQNAQDPLGRDEELGLLAKRWRRVLEGEGQVALISGEPGIGKTRLLQTLVARIVGQAGTIHACQCSPYVANSAFFPLLDLLRWQLSLPDQPTTEEVHRRLQAKHEGRNMPDVEAVPLIASMLAGIPLRDISNAELLPRAQREKLIEWLLQWIIGGAATRPLVLIVEDVHWADASTIDFIGLLVDQIASARIFLLVTFRSEFRPPWPVRSHVTQLTLNRLSSTDVKALVFRLTEGKRLLTALLNQVVTKTDGVPLFVEEYTKMVIEAGALDYLVHGGAVDAAAPRISVPDTLRGSLLARLDRQGVAKGIAQVAAVIDNEISFRLLQVVTGVPDEELKARLGRLVDAELLFQRGIPPDAVYTFKHSLIRDAAYQSLLKSQRAQYHRLTAEALLAHFAAFANGHPEFVAHHYSEAGLSEQAIRFWWTAGQRALQTSANVEAAAHLEKGLHELKALPATSERTGLEVEMQIALGTALTAVRGYGASEVERAYARAFALCENLGDAQRLFTALTGLHTFYQVRGPLQTAREVAERLVALAERDQDVPRLAQAHRRLGWSLFCLGELQAGKSHLDRVLALNDHDVAAAHSVTFGAHPWVVGSVNSAWVEWFIGDVDKAVERSDKALQLARKLGRPLSLAYALCMSGAMYQCIRDPQRTLELALETIDLAERNSLPYWIAWGSVLHGWALAKTGKPEAGLEKLGFGLRAYRETGAELFRAYSLALLAEVCRTLGRVAEALDHLDDALASAGEQNVHFFTAEIHRLRGDLMREAGKSAQAAAACYRDAISLAATQGAYSLEVRATVSLAELLAEQGDRKLGCELLERVLARGDAGKGEGRNAAAVLARLRTAG